MYCKHCGEQNPENAEYCRNCGTKLKNEEIKKATVIEKETTTNTSTSSGKGDSNWLSCCVCLIAIFIIFGILGILGF